MQLFALHFAVDPGCARGGWSITLLSQLSTPSGPHRGPQVCYAVHQNTQPDPAFSVQLSWHYFFSLLALAIVVCCTCEE